MKFTTLLALFGVASATITIQEQDVQKIAEKYAEWGQQEMRTQSAQVIEQQLSKAFEKATVKTDLYANKVLEPLVSQIQADMKRSGFPATCDVEQFAQCIIRGHMPIENARHSMCAIMYRCQIMPTSPLQDAQYDQESREREQRFQQAVNQYYNSVAKDLQKAAVKIQGHVNRIGDDFAAQTRKIMRDAGCDPACSDMCTANFLSMDIPQCFQACDCPEIVSWKPEAASWQIDVQRQMAFKASELDLQEMEPLFLKDDGPKAPPEPKPEAAGDNTMVYGGFALAAALFCMVCTCNKSNDVDDYDQEAEKGAEE